MRSAQASSISESQYCRIKEFVDNNDFFAQGSTPSQVTLYSWVKGRILPVTRIKEERLIDLSTLKTNLEEQALQRGFRYEFGKTTLVKLALFPWGVSLFLPSAMPCRRTVYNWEKSGLLCILNIGKSRFVDIHATEQRLKREGQSALIRVVRRCRSIRKPKTKALCELENPNQTEQPFQAVPSHTPCTWDTFLWGCPLPSQEKALPDKIVLNVRTALHGITDLNGFIRYLEGNPSNHALGKSLLHNVHQKTLRENELKLSTRKLSLYLPAPYQGGTGPRKTLTNHCSLPGHFSACWPFRSPREVQPPLAHVNLLISQQKESVQITMYIMANLLRTLNNHPWLLEGHTEQRSKREQLAMLYFHNPSIHDQKSANWISAPITAEQRTEILKKMLTATIEMEWEDIKRAYCLSQQKKYPVESIWNNGVSVTLTSMEVCYHYLSTGNAPFIVKHLEPFFKRHFKEDLFRTHGEWSGAIDCGKVNQESLVSCHGYPRKDMELVCYAKTADILKFELRCNRGGLVADFPEGACKKRMCGSLDDLCRLIDRVIKHSRGRIENLVNSLSEPSYAADSIAPWWLSVLNMDRKLRLWSESPDSELKLRASQIKMESLKALITPEGWPIRNLGMETVNFLRRMERKGYVQRHAGKYHARRDHALEKTSSNHHF